MPFAGAVPRRCVNLPPGSLRTLISCILRKRVQQGPQQSEFPKRFADWLGVTHVFGASSGRTAFQLALEALEIEKGREIIFPVFTFPVMPLVAKMLGYKPVFCDVDPETYNSGPEQVAPLLNENTGAVLATHLFGQPCDIRGIAELIRGRDIRLLEDCAHACGVRVEGQQAGTFGDVGIFSFAEGKNMPCFAGGAIATSDDVIAERTRAILAKTEQAPAKAITQKGISIWIKWLLTRPLVFGLTGYPVLRLKLALGKPLMDSSVGNTLLSKFAVSNPRITPQSNLSAAVGLLQLKHIDAFNQGARRNANILTERIGEVPGVSPPDSAGGTNIYVYYPLTVDAGNRDELRHRLLRNGIDTKISDMSDCSVLDVFRDDGDSVETAPPREASIIEICVYPVVPESQMHKIAKTIRAWASLPEL
jgi:perosamine synthetase